MSTLENIRKRAGVLVAVVIGLALLAFIMGDMFNSGSSLFRDSQLEIAEVAGNSIPVQLYQERLEKSVENYKRNTQQGNLDEATADQIREQTWQDLIRENVMRDEFGEIGLDVCPDELFDMVQGNNIHPSIMQVPIFQDQTGQFDPFLVIQFLKNLDQDATGNLRVSWLEFEKSIMQERLNNKYNTLLKKGFYITTDKAEEEAKYRASKVNIDYIVERYNTVPDSLLSFTEEDIVKLYEENSQDYQQEATRKLEYVAFDIIPSQEDDEMAGAWIEDITVEFTNANNDKQFVNLNGDTGFDETYYSEGELNGELNEFAFKAEIGDVYGPYKDADAYKLAKLTTIDYLPDSVRARHILIKPDEETGDISRAQFVIDSLKELVENGTNFVQLAFQFGTDGTATKGGDLGWFGPNAMVQPFGDSCFFNEKGHLTTVTTQFGVHLIEVTDRSKEVKKVQVAILDRIVIPSNKTVQFIYQQASEFAGLNNSVDKFIEAAIDQGLNKRISPPLRINDKQITGLESPRELVRWAFNTEESTVSPVFEFGDKFVVAALTEANEKGAVPLDQIRTEIENLVKKEKAADYLQKKVEDIFSANDNLEAIAQSLGTEMKNAENVTFTAYSIPGVGAENEMTAVVSKLQKDEMSEVIRGKNGIYVVKATEVIESDPADTKIEQSKLVKNYTSRVDYQAYETLKKKADIVDKRYKFY